MENMDWLYRIAPWLKDAAGGGASGGGSDRMGMLTQMMPWLKNLPGAGGGAAQNGMFGGGGWPFFGNAGANPATPVSTGTAPTGRSGGYFDYGGFGGEGGGRPFGGSSPQGGVNPAATPTGGRGGFSAPQGGMMRGFEEGGRPGVGEDVVVGENGPEVVRLDQPGTVIPNHAIPPWLQDAMVQMPAPAPQSSQMDRYSDTAAELAQRLRAPGAEKMGSAPVRLGLKAAELAKGVYDDPASIFGFGGITGQIIESALRNASPNAAQAQSIGGKKVKKPEQVTPMDEVMKEQQFLFDKGFYKGEIDGADGPKTRDARKEYEAAQRQLEALAAQRESAAASTALAGAQSETAKAQLEKTKLEAEALRTKTKQREEGQETLRKSEADLPWYSKLLRDYGTGAGIAIGAAAGPAARSGVRALGDKFLTKNATAAEGLFEKGGVPIVRKNLNDRIANVNEFWRKGGAGEAVPFLPAPAAKAGVTANLEAKNPGALFTPGFMATKGADAAAAGAMGAEAGVSAWQKAKAQDVLEKATAAVKEDPSEINIREYQAAKDRVATMDLLMNIGRTGAGSYVLAGMAKPRQAIKPNTAPAEAEKLNIEKLLRGRAEKEGKVSTKAVEKAPEAAVEGAKVPTNPMRKFDNQGNPINRGESTPSLQELTEPEPIRAHVPRRTRKKAENG